MNALPALTRAQIASPAKTEPQQATIVDAVKMNSGLIANANAC